MKNPDPLFINQNVIGNDYNELLKYSIYLETQIGVLKQHLDSLTHEFNDLKKTKVVSVSLSEQTPPEYVVEAIDKVTELLKLKGIDALVIPAFGPCCHQLNDTECFGSLLDNDKPQHECHERDRCLTCEPYGTYEGEFE